MFSVNCCREHAVLLLSNDKDSLPSSFDQCKTASDGRRLWEKKTAFY